MPKLGAPPVSNFTANTQPNGETLAASVRWKDQLLNESYHRVPPEVEPQHRLTSLVRAVAQQLANCFENVRMLQRSLLESMQENLGREAAGVSAMQVCMKFLRNSDGDLASDGLRGLCNTCDQILKDCELMSATIQECEQARKQWQHYQSVAVMLESQAQTGDIISMNRGKLSRAKVALDEQQRERDLDLKTFRERCGSRTHALLYALLHNFTQVVVDWADGARLAQIAFDTELRKGQPVRVVGVQQYFENGCDETLVVDSVDITGRECVVVMPDGLKQAVKSANVCPARVLASIERELTERENTKALGVQCIETSCSSACHAQTCCVLSSGKPISGTSRK